MSMSGDGATTTGNLGAAVQQVWAGAGKKYPRIATGHNGERHIIKSEAEEPHEEDVQEYTDQHGHDVANMTAGERESYQHRISGLFKDRRKPKSNGTQGQPGLTSL
jgi:hypothetical protein